MIDSGWWLQGKRNNSFSQSGDSFFELPCIQVTKSSVLKKYVLRLIASGNSTGLMLYDVCHTVSSPSSIMIIKQFSVNFNVKLYLQFIHFYSSEVFRIPISVGGGWDIILFLQLKSSEIQCKKFLPKIGIQGTLEHPLWCFKHTNLCPKMSLRKINKVNEKREHQYKLGEMGFT